MRRSRAGKNLPPIAANAAPVRSRRPPMRTRFLLYVLLAGWTALAVVGTVDVHAAAKLFSVIDHV